MKSKSKKIRTVGRLLLIALAAAVIGVNVYAVNAAHLAGNLVPMPFGVGAAVVLSGSMEPELSTGDLLILAERHDYAVGDVIVFQDGRMAVTHRIVAMDEDIVITKGDANNAEDDPIQRDQIKGVVLLSIPLVGYVVNAIKTPVGTLILLAAAVLFLERSFRAEKEKDARELAEIKAEIERLKQEQNKN